MGRTRSDISARTWVPIKEASNDEIMNVVSYFCELTLSEFMKICRHLDENSQLVIIKEAGHAVNLEKAREFYKHIIAFMLDSSSKSKSKSKVITVNTHNLQNLSCPVNFHQVPTEILHGLIV